MLLNTEELLALANGEVEPERLEVLLDRLEDCPDSAAALQVLVTLKANRQEALDALRLAAETDPVTPVPFPQPSAQPMPSAGWATQGLRLAATIAIVGLLGVWAASSFLLGPGSAHELATREFVHIIGFSEIALTASANVEPANRALHERRYEDALRLLDSVVADDYGYVLLYRGMAQYWLTDYEAAAETLRQMHDLAGPVDSGVRLQGRWYEANALLALDRPWAALPLLEEITTSSFEFEQFTPAAEASYDALGSMLGVNTAADSR